MPCRAYFMLIPSIKCLPYISNVISSHFLSLSRCICTVYSVHTAKMPSLSLLFSNFYGHKLSKRAVQIWMVFFIDNVEIASRWNAIKEVEIRIRTIKIWSDWMHLKECIIKGSMKHQRKNLISNRINKKYFAKNVHFKWIAQKVRKSKSNLLQWMRFTSSRNNWI